jgi:hypothetical protein
LKTPYDKLWQTIGQIMGQFHPDECLSYFKNAAMLLTNEEML